LPLIESVEFAVVANNLKLKTLISLQLVLVVNGVAIYSKEFGALKPSYSSGCLAINKVIFLCMNGN